MPLSTGFRIASILSAVVLAACGGSEPASTASNVGSAKHVDADTPPDIPRPLLDALWARVDAGEWSLEQGLTQSLEAVAGIRSLDSVYKGQPVFVEELTPVIRTATAYLKTGEDNQVRSEVSRLLGRLILKHDEIEQYAQPELSEMLERTGLPAWLRLIDSAHADADCDAMIRDTRPDPATLTEPCYRRRDVPAASGPAHSIYYPAQWADRGAPEMRLVDMAADGLRRSDAAFSRLGDMHRIYLIFGTGVLSRTPGAWAAQTDYSPRSGDPGSTQRYCDITFYAPGLALGDGAFKQTVAHEVFHCFQSWNALPQYEMFYAPRGPQITGWWVEGTAEYFSNVVYPRINDEWRRRAAFDADSVDTPIHWMSYQNWIFFQYLANELGDNALVELMRRMPTGGDSAAQAGRLSTFRDMQRLFHEFGKAYLDVQIQDTGGGVIPPVRLEEGEEFEIESEQRFRTRPFVLYRARLKFPGTAPKRLQVEESGTEGRHSVQRQDDAGPGPWQDMPEQVGTGLSVCEAQERNYRLLMTAASPAGEPYRLTLRLEDASGDGEDLSNAAYRYRNFPGAMKMLEEGGPDVLVPDRERGFTPTPDETAEMEANKNPLHCHMSCSLACICDHPSMHSSRTITLSECYEYVEDGRREIRWIGGERYTECERLVNRLDPQYRPSAFATIETYCARTCGETCGWPPG